MSKFDDISIIIFPDIEIFGDASFVTFKTLEINQVSLDKKLLFDGKKYREKKENLEKCYREFAAFKAIIFRWVVVFKHVLTESKDAKLSRHTHLIWTTVLIECVYHILHEYLVIREKVGTASNHTWSKNNVWVIQNGV